METPELSSPKAISTSVSDEAKIVTTFCKKISPDGKLEHTEGNLFSNLGLCNGSSKSPEASSPTSQKRTSPPREKNESEDAKKKKRSKIKTRKCGVPDEEPLFAADPIKVTTRVQGSKKTCGKDKDKEASSSESKSTAVNAKEKPGAGEGDSASRSLDSDWKVKEEILSKYLVVVADPIDAEVFEKEKKKCKKLNEQFRRK